MIHSCGARGPIIDATLIVTALGSYPFLYLFDRANIEVLVCIPVALGVAAFVAGRYYAASVLWGVAISIKPFPILFFLLLLWRLRVKEILAGAAAALVLNLAALAAIGPSIPAAYASMSTGVGNFYGTFATSYRLGDLAVDHSLFALFKQLVRAALRWPDPNQVGPRLAAYGPVYFGLCAVLGLGSTIWFFRKPFLNQLFAVVLLMLLLPFTSFDYTLIYLYLPWGLFLVCVACEGFPAKKSLGLLLPLALIFTPQTYLIVGSVTPVGAQIKALALLWLLAFAAIVPIPSARFDQGSFTK
jgi:hypothetical protein